MKIIVDLPEPDEGKGFKFRWEEGFSISSKIDKSCTVIQANKEGLISLARHLLQLAQERFPIKYHFHLDESNSLETGSSELIFQKVDG